MYTHVKASLDDTSLGVDTFWVSFVADFPPFMMVR